MEDTDWRPSPCPCCGFTREAARNPVCQNTECKCYGLVGDVGERIMKTEKQYVWLSERTPIIIHSSELELVYKDTRYNADKDRIFELGPEVKLELNVKVTPATRSANIPKQDPKLTVRSF
jgi:hypothetical protein